MTLCNRLAAAAAALALCAAPALCMATRAGAGQAALAPAGPTVRIDNFTFGPAVLTVKAGATVVWTNGDDVPHTVVAADHVSFRSKVLDTDQSFAFTFTRPGEYPYFCSLHPHMTGKVIVQ